LMPQRRELLTAREIAAPFGVDPTAIALQPVSPDCLACST